jgi:hypothetical protein
MRPKDYWERVRDDDRLALVRKKLSLEELRILFMHARDSIQVSPRAGQEIFEPDYEETLISDMDGCGPHGAGSTPAIALCIAALRARQAREAE